MNKKGISEKVLQRLSEKEEKLKKREEAYLSEVNKLSEKEKVRIKELWEEYAEARTAFESDYSIFSGVTTDFQEQLDFMIAEKNKSKEALAEAVGIEARTLRRYCAGHNSPSM